MLINGWDGSSAINFVAETEAQSSLLPSYLASSLSSLDSSNASSEDYHSRARVGKTTMLKIILRCFKAPSMAQKLFPFTLGKTSEDN